MTRIHRVNTPFNRIWHNNPFLTGSLQSLTTLAETRKRRDFIAPFFSKSAISRAEPTLHGAKLRTFLTTLAGAQDTIVDFYLGFRCLTADLVMDYCFQSDLDALHSPSFTNHTISTMAQGSEMALVATFFPGLSSLLTALVFRLPESVRAAYFAPLYGFETMQNVARQKVEEALDRAHEPGQTRNMMDAMARPDAQRGQDRPSKRDMVADGCLMIAAGTDTTANTLGKILWHVTQDVRVQERLVEELKRGMGREEVLESARLEGEGFEYLRAVVKEGLRLSYGVPGRIIRRVPREGAKFGDVWVPGGVSCFCVCFGSIH
jgi:cytochrome P450